MKILFVCLGNICRSPLAEAIFNHKVSVLKLGHLFEADSCGTSNYNLGDSPDERTLVCAYKNSIPIAHQARQLRKSDLQNFDLILAMDKNNLNHVLALCNPEQALKVKLMRSYDPLGIGDVPDPYYGDAKDFELVFKILNRSIDRLIEQLTENPVSIS